MTLHAEEEMDDDGLTVLDVERIIQTGHILQRQKDRATGEWKYVISGLTETETAAAVVAKIGATGKVVIITVFLE